MPIVYYCFKLPKDLSKVSEHQSIASFDGHLSACLDVQEHHHHSWQRHFVPRSIAFFILASIRRRLPLLS